MRRLDRKGLRTAVAKETSIAEPRVTVQVEPLLLRKADAARLLSISPRTFDDLVDAGLIGKWKLGGVTAFDVDDLRAFVRRNKREPEKVQAALSKLRSARKARRESDANSAPR
jgi:hypothetical protein